MYSFEAPVSDLPNFVLVERVVEFVAWEVGSVSMREREELAASFDDCPAGPVLVLSL